MNIAAVLTVICVGLLLLAKVMWNIAIPYIGAYQLERESKQETRSATDERGHGVSVMPSIDVLLLGLATFVAWLSPVGVPPLTIALVGGIAVGMSHLYLLLIAPLIFRCLFKGTPPPTDGPA